MISIEFFCRRCLRIQVVFLYKKYLKQKLKQLNEIQLTLMFFFIIIHFY